MGKNYRNYSKKHNNNHGHSSHTHSFDQNTNNAQLIALDSNVFINMSHHMHDNNIEEGFRTPLFKKLQEIRQKADQGLIKFVITPSVFGELTQGRLSKVEIEFLKKYCVLLEPKDEVEFARKTAKLMLEYVKRGAMDSPTTRFGDAKIMAECTIAGLNIITDNYRDFIIYGDVKDNYKYDRDGDFVPKHGYNENNVSPQTSNFTEPNLVDYLHYKGRDRSLAVGVINDEMGYSYVNKKGFKVTPMAFTSMDYIGKNSSKQGLWKCKQFTGQFNQQEFDLNVYSNTNSR